MQKIRKSYRKVHEIGVRVKLRYIYGTNTRNRAGPLPRPHGLKMHIQRPPRGQAWPHGRSWSWIWRFQLNLLGILSFFILSSHLVVIWQCPSGTAFEDNILQFNSFSVHPVSQRTSGLKTEKFIELRFNSVSILWGRAPQKLLTKFLKFLEKNSKSKKIKKYFFDFGSKNYADRCNLVSGVRENSFFDLKNFLKIFDFWT